MTEIEAHGALIYLERKLGRTPSVADVAEQMSCSTATALYWLDKAAEQGMIVKRNGKFMSLAVARAYRKEGENG